MYKLLVRQITCCNCNYLKFPKRSFSLAKSEIDYVQGEYRDDPKKSGERIRLYFYYIDHNGMLFLDDSRIMNFTSCFKEVKFLNFFFKRLQINKTGWFEKEFPYLSTCPTWRGMEHNYVRCDDLPQVFTHLTTIKDDNQEYLSWAHTGNMLVTPFEPENVFMDIESGRVYHPGSEKIHGVGLIRSKLAIELSDNFIFEDGNSQPVYMNWKGKKYKLTNEVAPRLKNRIRHPSGHD